jgi:hypothetical protein
MDRTIKDTSNISWTAHPWHGPAVSDVVSHKKHVSKTIDFQDKKYYVKPTSTSSSSPDNSLYVTSMSTMSVISDW